MFKFRLLLLSLLLLAWTSQGKAQFAHTDHKQIVDAAGKPLLPRATNLGNWMVPEGYMWLFQDGPQSPSEIRALVLELLGPEGSAAFWQKYRENYVTREDIALLHRADRRERTSMTALDIPGCTGVRKSRSTSSPSGGGSQHTIAMSRPFSVMTC